jgi:hypothetical protein
LNLPVVRYDRKGSTKTTRCSSDDNGQRRRDGEHGGYVV